MSDTRYDRHRREYRGVLEFDAEELRNIAYALGLRDVGAQDMLALADHLDELNGVPL